MAESKQFKMDNSGKFSKVKFVKVLVLDNNIILLNLGKLVLYLKECKFVGNFGKTSND